MKLSTKSEYSLLALIYIARHQKKGLTKIEDICEKYNISKKYLENLMTILKQNRFINTKRGAQGGYQLAISANKISVAEIIRIMDGALAPTLAVSKYFYSQTHIEKEKKLLGVFKEIRDYIAHKLEKLKISDLI
ncbi:MAG: Rrf2 family transcriptional regulator [Candidatus Margulisbacteria bacterium]|nr:Rrf2 family transcriptional regulator [Candidatus Margulisiibacteriota bacterium]